jgi:hypothetical protein
MAATKPAENKRSVGIILRKSVLAEAPNEEGSLKSQLQRHETIAYKRSVRSM